MINSGLKDKVIAVLTKHGLTEQRMAKGMYSKDGGISADLTGKNPVIGMMINGKVQPEGNSNSEITQMQNEVEIIMSKSSLGKSQSPVTDLSAPPNIVGAGEKHEGKGRAIPSESKLGAGDTPAQKGTTTAICQSCKCIITGTIDTFRQIQDEYGVIYCPKCSEQKEEPPIAITKIPMCRKCGLEVDHQRALECLAAGEGCTHHECNEDKHEYKAKEKNTRQDTQANRNVPVAEPREPEQKENIMDTKLPEIIKETEHKLTVNTIKQYLCPTATDAEAYNFLQLCIHRDLNPFLKEAYLIKYGGQPATMVVGKDAFTRKAEESGKLDGYEAGIIVLNKDKQIERRVGVVQFEGDVLVGGWAKVYRKDMKYPFVTEVPLTEYLKRKPDGTPQSSWGIMPGTMIRKVALVQDLREAFPKELGGCYDAVEMGTQDNIK